MRFLRVALAFCVGAVVGAVLGGRLYLPRDDRGSSDASAVRTAQTARSARAASRLKDVARLLGVRAEETEDELSELLVERLRELQRKLLLLTDLPSDTPLPALCDRLAAHCEQLSKELAQVRQSLLATATAEKPDPAQDSLVSYVNELHQERLEQQAVLQEQIERKDREIAELADRLQSLAARLRQEHENRRQIEAEMLREVDRLRTALESLRRYVPPPFEIQRQDPDGKVVRANNVKGVAWINLGSRDGVRPGITFSVWSALDSVGVDRPKAKLMVTRVIDRGLSEARIVECDPRHPVVAGDLVGSLAWSPRQQTAFVLAGVIDLDGDGKDDRALVRAAIERNGGRVVAELLPDGTVKGTIDTAVRYFVRGQAPSPAARAAMARLEGEARDFGAYIIDEEKLADFLGLSLAALRYGRD